MPAWLDFACLWIGRVTWVICSLMGLAVLVADLPCWIGDVMSKVGKTPTRWAVALFFVRCRFRRCKRWLGRKP